MRMTDSDRASTLRRDLRLIYADGLFYSLMVGLGESSFPAFALALGMSAASAGMMATLPMFLGAALQLGSFELLRAVGSKRRWIAMCVGLQAASFVPLIAGAWHGSLSFVLLYAIVSLYWALGFAAGPSWNTWVETLVPPSLRRNYFARRTRMLYLATLVALLAAGAILEWGSGSNAPLAAFAVVFALSLLARGASGACLASQSEPVKLTETMRAVSLWQFVVRLRHGRDGRLIAYMLVYQFAGWVMLPFLLPYLLAHLHFGYIRAMSLIAASFAGKYICLFVFERTVRRMSVRGLMWVGSVGMLPATLLWICGDSLAQLLLAQLAIGACLAAFELSTFLCYFDAIPAHERTSVLTSLNLGNAAVFTGGSALGALVLSRGHDAREAYLFVFGLSAFLRVLSLFFLRRVSTGSEEMTGQSRASA